MVGQTQQAKGTHHSNFVLRVCSAVASAVLLPLQTLGVLAAAQTPGHCSIAGASPAATQTHMSMGVICLAAHHLSTASSIIHACCNCV